MHCIDATGIHRPRPGKERLMLVRGRDSPAGVIGKLIDRQEGAFLSPHDNRVPRSSQHRTKLMEESTHIRNEMIDAKMSISIVPSDYSIYHGGSARKP
jgi:hypothetical protein